MPPVSHRRIPAIIRHGGQAQLESAEELAPGLLVHGAPVHGVRRRPAPVALAVDGCGVVGSRFVTDTVSLQEVLDRQVGGRSGSAIGSSIRGVLTLYLWHPDLEMVEILPDTWGGLVYCYRAADVEVFSSDLGAVLHALSDLGRMPAKSLDFVSEVAALGSGGLAPVSYDGIEVLDVFEYLRVTPARSAVLTYPTVDDLSRPFDSYQAGLDAIEDEVLGNVQAVAQYAPLQGDRLVHLTAGLDTRMLLAA